MRSVTMLSSPDADMSGAINTTPEFGHVADAPAASERLVDLYKRWFDVVPADTPELLCAAHRLRYQVYCVENDFENPADHPSGLEADEFDRRAVHSLLIHRPSGAIAGTVRLILGDRKSGVGSLPIARVCHDPLLRDPSLFPPRRTAEISRFAVSKSFRRRATDGTLPDLHVLNATADADLSARRVAPHITLGLMRAVADMSMANGVTHLCAVMEPALLRLVRRVGITFSPLGPTVEYHGTRQPCYAHLVALGCALEERRPDALELISDDGRHWPLKDRRKAAG